MTKLLVGLLLAGLLGRGERAAQQLADAKQAYQAALARTGDFDCLAPDFDEVLKKLDAVPRGTAARKDAAGLAAAIREKRTAAAQHGRAVDQAAAAPAAAPAPAKPLPADCKQAGKRLLGLKVARKKAGKPPLGEMAFQSSGEVAYAPGAEPTPEEASLLDQLKQCSP